LLIEDLFVFYVNWESRYSPEISPDGMNILFQGMNGIQIVHTGRMDIECVVPTPNNNLFDMAFTPDSKRVCLAHGFMYDYYSVIYINGPDSYLEHTINVGKDAGLGCEYNPVDGKFYLLMQYNILTADPVSGLLMDTIFLNASSRLVQIGIDPLGNPVTQGLRHLQYNGQEYYLRECCEPFKVYNETYQCLIPRPGPDNIFVLNFLTAEIDELPMSGVDKNVLVYPNPTHDRITIKSDRLVKRIELFSSGGELLHHLTCNNSLTTLDLSDYPSGVYMIKLRCGKENISRKVLLTR
jgi:hypothetical protein